MNRRILGWGSVVVLGLAVVLGVIFASTHGNMTVTLDQKTDRASAIELATQRTVFEGNSTGSLLANSGDYLVKFWKGKDLVGEQVVHLGAFASQNITCACTPATSSPLPILHRSIDAVQPLGNGYLYLYKPTRSIEYADQNGVSDLSSSFDLSTRPAIPDTPDYSTFVGSYPLPNGGLLVATTKSLFVVKSLSDISRLPAYDKAFLNFTSVTYDAKTNSAYALSSYDKNIYRYDLAKLDTPPTIYMTAPLEVNRLAAGNGQLVAYYDNLPSVDSAALVQYAQKRQVTPLLIDLANKKTSPIDLDGRPATQVTLSADGRYIALKPKFSSIVTIYDHTTGQRVQVPADDAGGLGWQSNHLFIARDNALWQYTPGRSELVRQAATGAPVTWLTFAGTQPLYLTNDNTLHQLNATSTPPYPTSLLTSQSLTTTNYIVSYIATPTHLTMIVQAVGATRAPDQTELRQIQDRQFAQANAILVPYIGRGDTSIIYQDVQVLSPYLFAAIPNDG